MEIGKLLYATWPEQQEMQRAVRKGSSAVSYKICSLPMCIQIILAPPKVTRAPRIERDVRAALGVGIDAALAHHEAAGDRVLARRVGGAVDRVAELVGAGVRLVDNHEFRTGAKELMPPSVALDVVCRDHREWIALEQRLILPAITLEPRSGARKHEFGLDMKLLG